MTALVCAKCASPIQGHAVQGPGGWMHTSCAQKAGSKSAVPLLALVGCAVSAGFVLLILAFLAIWQFLSPGAPPTSAVDAGASDALTERYTTGNGLVTVRYPASFAASKQGDAAVIVTRPLADGNAETLVFEAVETPVSNDLKELERLLSAAEAKQLEGYVALSTRPGTCHGRPGIEVIGSFVTKNGATYDRRACRFYDDGHFYSFAYALPRGKPAAETRLLETIVDAAEIRVGDR